MNKKLIFGLLVVFSFIVLTSNTSAFFPLTHKYLNNELMSTYEGESDFYELCLRFPDLCYTGNVLTDMSVVYYYVNGGVNYEVTHSPGFCLSMMENAVGEEEKACAIGSCLHATQDLVSHTEMVTESIHKTLQRNEVIHVFSEQHLDNYVIDKYPIVKTQLVQLDASSWDKCVPLLKRTLRGYDEYGSENIDEAELDDVIYTFISEVTKSVDNDNTGYDVSFKNKVGILDKLGVLPITTLLLYLGFTFFFLILSILLIFKRNKNVLNWVSLLIFAVIGGILLTLLITSLFGSAFVTFVTFIKPISNVVPIGDAEGHLQKSIKNGYAFFDDGEEWMRNQSPASGFDELNEANEDIKLMNYLIMGLLFFILLALIYANFRKKPKKNNLFLY